ncbi:8-oxoguanine DNA glycosylase OGG fold protein [Spirosoma flavum]|uniref:5-hmdU DNA kinase helical domain-containing protein n=1 Tax=Spirosoma flavum TaxID=2048557 RepID=A0ABW6ANX7_9BACT
MNIATFHTLIAHLPVQQQCFKTKRSNWRKAEFKLDWLERMNDKLFDKKESINICRQDIFNTKDIRERIIKTIYWGYPRGMRGNHFVNILNNIETIEKEIKKFSNRKYQNSYEFQEVVQAFKTVPGLGLSTYSKLLYFFKIRLNGNQCLILDQRVIDVLASKFYDNFKALSRISYSNAESKYFEYVEMLGDLSKQLKIEGENIEQFLFIFGNSLKKEAFLLDAK